MIFKLIGCSLIFASGFILSRRLNAEAKKKTEQLSALVSLLRFFRTQIDLYCVPVGEIFRRCDRDILRGCGCSTVPVDFEGFAASLDPLPDERLGAVLSSFASELGSSYKEEQLKSLDHHISRITELFEAEEREYAKRKKLNTTLCLSGAALIVILLI